MQNHDELLDADAAADNRRHVRRTVVFTTISLALVLVTCTLMVVGGFSA